MYDDIECPYCGKGFDIDTCDGFGCTEDEVYEQECPHCEKNFIFTVSWSPFYTAEKADCLNGAPHTYKPSHTYPVDFVKMVCSQCDDHRDPTPAEWEQIEKDRGEKRGDWARDGNQRHKVKE